MVLRLASDAHRAISRDLGTNLHVILNQERMSRGGNKEALWSFDYLLC